MTDPVITPEDVAAAGFCLPGIRPWCRTFNISMRDLIAGKITVSQVRALGCSLGERVCVAAEKRSQGTQP